MIGAVTNGYEKSVTDQHDRPTLDDVMETTETRCPIIGRHAKALRHLDDDEPERRTEEERREVGLDDDSAGHPVRNLRLAWA